MGRLIRVILYALIILVLYFVIDEIIRTYQKSSKPSENEVAEVDSVDVLAEINDTLSMDTLPADELITNEEIVGAGTLTDSPETATTVQKTENTADKKSSSTAKTASPPVKTQPSVPSKTQPPAPEKTVQKAPAKKSEPVKKSEPAKKSEHAKVDKKTSVTSRPAKKPEPKPEPVKQQVAQKTDQPGDGGKYMVMAGSYLLRDNATKMVKKLREMGFSNAEVVIFPESEFHSVIAVRYANEMKAQATATELKRKGIESFVKVK